MSALSFSSFPSSPGSPPSISGAPITARSPASATARAVAPGCQYMSQNPTVPVRIISAHASRAPQYTSSASSFASTGQIFFSSHSISGRSSP